MNYLKSIKQSFLLAALFCPFFLQAQSNYSTRNGKISFFSSTPLEDIKAASNNGTAVLLSKTKDIAFQVPIKSFQFEKGLMQEHFNENYMESDKYPVAKFKGKLNQDIDLSKNGEYDVTSTGTLSLHGVDKPRTISGKLKVSDGKVQLISNFNVACVDHNIKIPTIVIAKVAEIIAVKVDAVLTPLTK